MESGSLRRWCENKHSQWLDCSFTASPVGRAVISVLQSEHIKHSKIYLSVLWLEWIQMEMLNITFDIRKGFFAVRVMRLWDGLQRGRVTSALGDTQAWLVVVLGSILWVMSLSGGEDFLLEITYVTVLFSFPPPDLPQSLLKTILRVASVAGKPF